MNTKTQINRRGKMVPVTIDGHTISVALSSLAKSEKRIVHHGQFGGTQVNSPATLTIGESTIIWPDATKGDVAFSIGNADLGLLSMEYLTSQGYSVTGMGQGGH